MTPQPEPTEQVVPAAIAAAVDRMTDGFVLIDRSWRYLFVNQRAAALLDRSAESLLGQNVWAEFPGAEEHEIGISCHRVMASGNAERMEGYFEKTKQWLDCRIFPTDDGIGIRFDNVDSRKMSERWAEGQRRVLERLASGAPLVDVLTEIIVALEQQCPGSMGSVQLSDPDNRHLRFAAGPHIDHEISRVLAAGIPIAPLGGGTCGSAAYTGRMQYTQNVYTDPRWEPFREIARRFGLHSCWSAPIFDSSQRLVGTIALYSSTSCNLGAYERGIVEDACHLVAVAVARTRADEELRERERELAAIAAHTPDVVVRVDREHRFTYVNDVLEHLSGLAARAYLGKRRQELPVDHSIDEAWDASLRQLFERGDPTEATFDVDTLMGRRRFDARLVPELDEEGVVTSAVIVMRDMTRQRQLEERLRQSQKLEAIGRLAGGVAHDFNNILTAVGGFAGLALESLEPEHPARPDLEELVSSVDRAADLTRQLLAFSRQQLLMPRVVDINGIASRLEPMLRRLLGDDVVLSVAPSRDPAYVLADPTQVEQVLMNLAVNSRDAMPSGGVLQVEVLRVELAAPLAAAGSEIPAGPWVVLAVSDTGEGMDAETRARIFEPFFTTKEPGSGTGLGLAMVYGVVQQSGGHVVVESAPGRGASFRVFLPPAPAPPAGTATDEIDDDSVAGPPESATILVVDDEATVRALVRRILEKQGYRVREAQSGADALWLSREEASAIDLLLTDVVMPGMDGRELAGRFVEAHPGARVLLMSGYTDLGDREVSEIARRHPLIEKPFTARKLLSAVRNALRTAV